MKLTKTKICGSLAVAATIAVFSGCGDESTTNNIDNTAVLAFDADSLPECAKANEGELAFNKTDNTLRICYDTEWYVLNGKDGEKGKTGGPGKKGETGDDGTGCTVKALDDKSGLKLICDGDSIGVVLNGEQGKPGGEGNSCVKCEAVEVTENGYSIKCDGEVVATILNGSAIPATKSSDSKQTSPASSSSKEEPATPVVEGSSSSKLPPVVVEGSSSSEETVDKKSSSSYYSTTYDEGNLPLNFNQLLNFFTVDDYTQTYVENGNYYRHSWHMTYGTGDEPGLSGGVIEAINSAAEGSGVFDEEYTIPTNATSSVYQKSSEGYLFDIEIQYAKQGNEHFYEIELAHREYISK